MRPPAMKPRFGSQGQDRSNSPHQMTRPPFPRPPPPFHKGPRHSRGNGNHNRHMRPQGPQGPIEGPGQPMMGRPNGPMMCPNVPMPPMMMPCGPMMGPNGPMAPPAFMDPTGFNMMMRPMMPGAPMQNFSGSRKEGIQPKEENKPSAKMGTDQTNASNSGENYNFNYPQSSHFQNTHCGWQGNTFPGAWNFNNPTNQFYPQSYGQNFNPQFSNMQSYYPNFDSNVNYNQYQNQPYMQGNYYNNQNHSDFKFNQNNWQNGAPPGSKTPSKNNSKPKESQKMRTHYCDTCDKSFPSEEALAGHLAEHKVCGLDGCKFTAHPKVVDKHQQMQHFTGLYRRIGSLYSPEDIEKWRKDRKKNYPTPQNVEERRAKQEEMFARGERMGARNNRFSRNNPHTNAKPFQPRQNPRANGEKREDPVGPRPPRPPPPDGPAEPPKKWKPIFPPVAFEIEESEERSGVVPFPGTAALKAEVPSTETSEGSQTNPNSSLTFLSTYGDSASEEDSDTEKSPADLTSCPVDTTTSSEPETKTGEAQHSAKSDLESSKEIAKLPTSLERDAKVDAEVPLPQREREECSSGGSGERGELQNGIAEEEPKLGDSSQAPGSLPSEGPEHPEHPASDSPSESANTNTEKPVGGAETATAAMDDSDDGGPEEVPISRSSDSRADEENSQDEDGEGAKSGEGGRKRRRQARQPPKKLKTEEEKAAGESQPQQQNRRHETTSRAQRPPHRPPYRRAPTLLEKLLSKEICHERNVILQCVRYVVENKYFRADQSQALRE